MAFLVCVGFSDDVVLRKLLQCMPHYLTGR
ncbi:hypothetical protein MH171_001540 [Vibrio parahaemolyticus]|nr:hypothetical protein [Vibrio parahaemolyticus]EGR2798255.1 hypothetical protein [Vibrio navarrensis]EGR0398548.1 hypothetical protein [Vibrio parahaemolyticus]EGR1755352.1 hypothetical protein [Vibrio parahaemolyticus]EGR3416585.1 hypothetical protein [Vibrio parahaemolyticus]